MCDRAADITIRSCGGITLADLHEGFCRAFSDYAVAMQPTFDEFRLMLMQRGFDETVSRVALAGRSVVSFWLVGTHPGCDSVTAYVIATGTAPGFRGRGLAKELHRNLHQLLAQGGVESMQLEVISGNKPARSLYARLGYQPVRDLCCFDINRRAIKPAATSPARVSECSLADIAGLSHTCCDWQASWQNAVTSLSFIPDALVCVAAELGGMQVGYGILIKPTGTIAQLAVRHDRRRAGIGSAVLQSLAAASPPGTLRVINADSRDGGFHAFLARHGGREEITQVEMVLTL